MKYVIGVIAVVLVTILAVVLIIGRDSPGQQKNQTGKQAVSLYEQAKDGGTVAYKTEGKVVGDEDHYAVRITVSSNTRKVEILRGYNETVEKSQTFTNTQTGYEEFLKAIELAGFSRKRSYTPEDERGVCPLGQRYTYEFEKSGEDSLKTWSTSCGAKQGTFGGVASTIRQLFQNQVPEYNQFVKGVRF
jgi:hypothetical protein